MDSRENIFITVIMPVYNSEQFLSAAIESVLNQDYIHFELLLIDDGSTDDSLTICENYAKRDHRIFVIHKSNGGVCSARNVGMLHAKGTYISFIDNDDFYEKNYLTELLSIVNKTNADVVKCGRKNIKITDEQIVLSEKSATVQEDCFFTNDALRKHYLEIRQYQVLGSIWNGLYRTAFLKNQNCQFDESLKHGNEDLLFNCTVFLKGCSVALSKKVLYNHFYRLKHSTSMKFYDDQIESRIAVIKKEQILVQENEQVDKILIEFEGIRECFRLLSLSKDLDERKKGIAYITSKLDFSILNQYFMIRKKLNLQRKIEWLLIRFHAFKLYFGIIDLKK